MVEAEKTGKGAARDAAVGGKTVVLIVALSAGAWAIWWVADWLREKMLADSLAGGGEWAALLGGGMATWTFFLIRSGFIEQTLDLLPKARAVLGSLRTPGWRTFFGDLGGFLRAMVLPGVVTVFALVFAGKEIVKPIVLPDKPEPDLAAQIAAKLAPQIAAVDESLDTGLGKVKEALGGVDLRAALNEQGYTDDRAELIDVLGGLSGATGGYPADYYFARFPVSFQTADVDDAGVLTVGVDRSSVLNADLVEEIARALLPCGAPDGEDPVILKVEGYASSEPFGTRADSDELNVETANRRRATVAGMLRDQLGPENAGRVAVCESPDHESPEGMEREREFNDLAGGTAVDQYLFTRAAHVKVLHPGRCAVGKERDTDRPGLTVGARRCLEAAKAAGSGRG